MQKSGFVEVTGLTKRYKSEDTAAVNNLSFSIAEKEIFGLLGPNGAGKTTTISMLSGLLQPTAGEITIDGHDIDTDHNSIKKMIGVVPQDIALYPTLTARENLSFFGTMYGINPKILKEKISHFLDILGLQKKADATIETYSGGMKRRTNLIAAILHDPSLLFLDEPTVGVDVHSRSVIMEFLSEINKEGTTIIYTSHHLEEAENFCSRIAIIDEGHILIDGNPKHLIASQPNCENLEAIFLHLTGKRLRD